MTYIKTLVHIQIIVFMMYIHRYKLDKRCSGKKNALAIKNSNLVLILSLSNSSGLVGSCPSRQEISCLHN